MPTFEEMSLWSAEEVHQQILAALPKGWQLTYSRSDETKALFCQVMDESGVRWSEEHSDVRLLLLDLYGWLLVRDAKVSNPVWIRREDPFPMASAQEWDTGPSAPDPEDLDPKAIAAFHKLR
jgi:hypothetical protein